MSRASAVFLAALFLAGCTGYLERSADREVAPILDGLDAKVDAERVSETPPGVITPKPPEETTDTDSDVSTQPPEEPAPTDEEKQAPEAEAPERIINLQEALALAFSTSRDFLRQKESLYLSALSFTGTLHSYSWRPAASVSGDVSTSGNGSGETVDSAGADATLSLTRTLLSGGQFSISASASQSGTIDGPGANSNSSSVSASFSHSLLAGTGVAAREPMVQARRSLLYAARSFELFRQNLAIGIISRYYRLIETRRNIETARERVTQETFSYEKSQWRFEKGMQSKLDVLRANQAKLNAEDALVSRIEDYETALDDFKLDLNLPADLAVDIADEPIEPEIVQVDLQEAIKTAFENRLDYITAAEQLEDVERGVEIVRNSLLPDLGLSAGASVSTASRDNLLDYSADDGSASLGLSLEIPLDRKSERNAYRHSLITLEQARRSFAETRDRMKLEIRDGVRSLRRLDVSLRIQKESVFLAEKRLEHSRLKVEMGEASNREVEDAQEDLEDARNSVVRAQVDYLIATITLKKNIGTLRVDERGMWQ